MSLKGDKYETAEEVKFRLENSVVMYDGKPVYINQVSVPDIEEGNGNEIARVYFTELPYTGRGAQKPVRKYLSSRKFDLSPFKMGYYNSKGSAVFATRNPIRQNRQGLSSSNLILTDHRGKKCDMENFGTMIGSQGFVDMINGKYPDFKSACDLLDDKKSSSVAISRSFAFVIDHDLEAMYLLHKSTKCGLALKGDKGIKVSPKFHFLREEMEDHRLPLV